MNRFSKIFSAIIVVLLNSINLVFAQPNPQPVETSQGVIPPIEPITIGTTADVVAIFINIVNWLFSIAGILAVAMVIYSAILFMTSGDSEESRKKASGYLKWSIVGIIVVALSLTITKLVTSFLVVSKN